VNLAAASEVSAGYLGLLIVLLIGVATVLLIRNMNARLKRLPKSFDSPQQLTRPDDGPDESASGPTSDA
jgi:hypothetical protein